MLTKTTKIIAIATLLGVTTLGLTACSNNSEETKKPNSSETSSKPTPIPMPKNVDDISTTVATQTANNYIVGPITGSPAEIIKAKRVRVPNQSELYIFPIDPSEQANWSATSSNEKVATFVQGVNGQPTGAGAVPPTFKALSVGESNIVLTNTVTGEKIEFVFVSEPIF